MCIYRNGELASDDELGKHIMKKMTGQDRTFEKCKTKIVEKKKRGVAMTNAQNKISLRAVNCGPLCLTGLQITNNDNTGNQVEKEVKYCTRGF